MKKSRWNQSQRMQLKILVCILGGMLLLILALTRLLWGGGHKKQEPEHIPVITFLRNVWIVAADEEKLRIFRDGNRETYVYQEYTENIATLPEPATLREQLADIELTDGRVTAVTIKKEKIHSQVLSANASGVELMDYGYIPLAKDYKGYRLYDELSCCTVADLTFGYDFADFVLENGEICGVLLARADSMEYIRVLLKGSDYSGLFHQQLVLTADTGFTIQYGSYGDLQMQSFQAGEEIVINGYSPYFSGERVWILPDALTGRVTLLHVTRSQGTPSYRGHLELKKTSEGIVAVNVLPMEEYLYSVVPSEMPASYPGEALKAQAVCARTYAYGHMLHAAYPEYGAHVDDSTSYQVYNNIIEQESTTTAVKETYGQLLYTEEGQLAETYYYSTSCGMGTDANVWKTTVAPELSYICSRAVNAAALQKKEESIELGERLREEAAFADFIRTRNPDDFEVEENWYRWTYQVADLDAACLSEALQKRFRVNEQLVLTLKDGTYCSEPVKKFTKVCEIAVTKRGAGGVAEELLVMTDQGTYKVISELNIRYVLCDGESEVLRQDGSRVVMPNLLPSGFFLLETGKEDGNVVGYTLMGGGFGHGVGMSQNGARAMAKKGLSAEEILSFFFDGCVLQNIYE